MHSVRAKFRIESRTETATGFQVKLEAVYDSNPESENGKFFRYTPSASITMQTINPAAAEMFKPGTEVYVDFTPAS
jgi:hypothetical protein